MKQAVTYLTRITLLSTAIVAAFSLSLLSASPAAAVSGSDWRPGHIIDDVIFENKNSMSVDQVQQFLNAKVPNCDRWGTQPYAGTTRRAYSEARGIVFPLTCLKDYHENTSTKANNLEGRGIPAGAKSAAQIIWEAGQNHNINPQVLIALLQKEQALVADDWPWPIQFKHATGYGCPDTAPCDSQYYGLYNQVETAAWQFRRYATFPNNYNFVPGLNYIQWNPNASCGGGNVNIVNQSTASLYNYTPYQPNTPALNNLYGTGDSCSAYGNRNFWRLFNDWFGSTYADAYSWQPMDQYVYTDETKTVGAGTVGIMAGQRVYIGIKAKNVGSATWTNNGTNPINVGTVRPTDRNSPFYDGSWLGPNRPARLVESSVAPGQIGTFEFWYKIPSAPGTYNEYFSLLAEGKQWMNDPGLYFHTVVSPPTFTWQPVDQYAYTDQTKTVGKGTSNLAVGDRFYVGIRAKNTGNMTWNKTGKHTVLLGPSRPFDRHSAFYDSSWLSQTRSASLVEDSVAPGQTGTFEFWVTARQGGSFAEFFNPVVEGETWMNDTGLNFNMQVNHPQYTWQLVSQYAYADETKATGKGTTNLNPGERVYVGFQARNTGNVTWKKNSANPVNVGMTHPIDRFSPFYDGSWLGENRPARMIEDSVAPGQIGTFEFWMKAPSNSGVYREYYSLVSEGAAWFTDPQLNFYMSVK